MKWLKVVVVGDGCVGKTSLLITYVTNTFPTVYTPTVFDHEPLSTTVGGIPVQVGFFDCAGGEDYHRLRPLSYPMTDLFFLCFSVENPDSLANIETYWVPELRHFCPGVPILLVACKSDLRCAWTEPTLSYDEGYAMAKRNGLGYTETSALTKFGLKECFDKAFRMAICGQKAEEKKRGFNLFKWTKKVVPGPPLMPAPNDSPTIEIEPSTFGDDWYKMLQDPTHSDVTFVLEGKHHVDAHMLVICSASETFAKIFGISKAGKSDDTKQINAIDNYTTDQLNSGQVPGIAALYHSDAKGHGPGIVPHTTVEISADISVKTFVYVLEFLYAGVPKLSDTDDDSKDTVKDLETVAAIFSLPQLQLFCTNILTGEEVMNPSIGTFMNQETGAKMKELFFNHPERADVVFNVDGTQIHAHRCVLTARSDVMAAMFSGNFAESTSDKTETYNASQLAKWCLFFIASNYTAFEQHPEFSQLNDDDKTYIEEKRWPPVSYLQEVAEYNKKYRKKIGEKSKENTEADGAENMSEKCDEKKREKCVVM